MRHLFLFEENDGLNIDMIKDSTTVVIRGSRSELRSPLFNLKEIQQPGVYFLISDNMMYIGQSGQNVLNRLKTHDTERDWWTSYLVITDTHGELEKTVTEYIEAYLIQLLRQKGLTLDNDTNGNLGKVSQFNKMKSQELIDKSMNIIFNVLNENVFKEQDKSNVDEVSTNSKCLIVVSDDNSFEGSSVKKALHAMLSHYSNSHLGYSTLMSEVTDSPSPRSIIVDNQFSSDNKAFWALSGDLYMYSKLNSKQAKEQIEYFLEVLQLELLPESVI